jgi:hypothetical protein
LTSSSMRDTLTGTETRYKLTITVLD